MKRIMTAMMALAFALALAGCVTAAAEEPPTARYDVEFAFVADWAAEDEPIGFAKVAQEQAERAAQAAPPEPVREQQAYDEPVYYEPVYYDDAPSYDNGDGFASQGRRWYNGGSETWYTDKSNSYDGQGSWSVDSEGYWRDADGYYVVASTDYDRGEVIDTSKGEAKVYDSGAGSGNTDFYVDF